MRRWLRFVMVGWVMVLAACSNSDEVSLEASDISAAGFLGETVERTTKVGFNFSMVMDVRMVLPSAPGGGINAEDVAVGTGQVEGERSRTVMDMGEFMQAMAPGAFPPEQLAEYRMEAITDAGAGEAFIRAPMFALLGTQPGGRDLGDLAQIGERWGRIDLTALGDVLPSEAIAQLTGGVVGFEPILDLVRNAENAQEVAPTMIRGAAATGVAAEVTFDEFLSLSGMSLDDLAAVAGAQAAEDGRMVETLALVTVPVTVWIDDAARIVRAEIVMDFGAAFDQIAAAHGEAPNGAELSYGYTLDAFDFGAPDAITVPDDWIDVTDSYRSLLAG